MKIRLLASAIALMMLLPATAGAGPDAPKIADIPVTGFSSENVTLVTTIQGVGSGVGGKFVTINDKQYYILSSPRGGFFVPSGVGTGGVWALDVTNPEQPIPAGFLPIPLTQNEDIEVSASKKIALFSADGRRAASVPFVGDACGQDLTAQQRAILCARIGGALVVVDISTPSALKPLSVFPYPEVSGFAENGLPRSGPGHTATCILDCNFVYVTNGRGFDRAVYVIDLRDPANPVEMGWVSSPAAAPANGFSPGVLHDVNVDKFGNVWMVGSGGTAMYAPITDPLKPKLLATISAADNAKTNQLIHHGSLRFDKNTVLIAEEAFGDGCGKADAGRGDYNKDGSDDEDGSLQTWSIDLRKKRINLLDTWDSELAESSAAGTLKGAVGVTCSSHWFDVNANKVVADGWYEQGVRFLDVRNPRKIRQVGYWLAPGAAASQAQYVPGRNDIVYVADYARGIDVIRIADGGRNASTVKAPIATSWLKGYTGINFSPKFAPDETYGYACKRPLGL